MKNVTYHNQFTPFAIGDRVHGFLQKKHVIGVIISFSNKYYSDYDGFVYNVRLTDGTEIDVGDDSLLLYSEPSDVLKEIL